MRPVKSLAVSEATRANISPTQLPLETSAHSIIPLSPESVRGSFPIGLLVVGFGVSSRDGVGSFAADRGSIGDLSRCPGATGSGVVGSDTTARGAADRSGWPGFSSGAMQAGAVLVTALDGLGSAPVPQAESVLVISLAAQGSAPVPQARSVSVTSMAGQGSAPVSQARSVLVTSLAGHGSAPVPQAETVLVTSLAGQGSAPVPQAGPVLMTSLAGQESASVPQAETVLASRRKGR